MKKINLSISGCIGRMGKQLINSSKKNKKFKIVSLTEGKLVNKKIYGKRIRVEFVKFIRGEKKFKNINYLKKQIKLDIKKAKKIN